ncbi:hypothetical protein I8Y06_003290 [Photobacterium damselae]|nr:hypothetical protein [Photobacterium damselae]
MHFGTEHKLVNMSNLKHQVTKEPFFEFQVFSKDHTKKFVYITDYANGQDYEFVSSDLEYVIGSICEQSQMQLDNDTVFFIEQTFNNKNYLVIPPVHLDLN